MWWQWIVGGKKGKKRWASMPRENWLKFGDQNIEFLLRERIEIRCKKS